MNRLVAKWERPGRLGKAVIIGEPEDIVNAVDEMIKQGFGMPTTIEWEYKQEDLPTVEEIQAIYRLYK